MSAYACDCSEDAVAKRHRAMLARKAKAKSVTITAETDIGDEALLDEFVDLVRGARNHGSWDRERLQRITVEVSKRGLIPGLRTEVDLPASAG